MSNTHTSIHLPSSLNDSFFTPIESLAGGAIMGIAVYHHLRCNGRITGISGILGGVLDNCDGDRLWRALFVVGMMLGGVFLKDWQSRDKVSFFEPHFVAFPIIMYILAGFLVGCGTRIGGGCSSGHMLVGLARASRRSLFATIVFAGVASIVSTIVAISTHDKAFATYNQTLHVQAAEYPWIAPTKWASPATTVNLFALTFASWLAFRTIVVLRRMNVLTVDSAHHYVSFLTGLFFSVGLGVSGMTKQGKVHGFLNLQPIFSKGGQWDPSLVMVLLGAMLPNFVFYHLRVRKMAPHFGSKLHLPSKTDLDMPLLVGSAIFGFGWGLVGICPGPALSNLGGLFSSFLGMPTTLVGSDYERMLAFMLAMLIGMANHKKVAAAIGV